MSGSFVIESAFGQKRIICHSVHSCSNHIYELPYFRGNVEQIISEGEGFDAVQDLLNNVKITGATWEITAIRTKIHFISPQQAQRIMSELENIAEDKYNQGLQDYRSQFGDEGQDQEGGEDEDQEPEDDEGQEPAEEPEEGDDEEQEPNDVQGQEPEGDDEGQE